MLPIVYEILLLAQLFFEIRQEFLVVLFIEFDLSLSGYFAELLKIFLVKLYLDFIERERSAYLFIGFLK
jgi:hypothetical protein